MKKVFLVLHAKALATVCCWLLFADLSAQTVSQRLQKAFTSFEKDEQLKHAISSLYVIDAKTGEVVFDKNSQIGLAPASTQKIITAATAFELLGKEYRYNTKFGYTGSISGRRLQGSIFVFPSGDPTLGSWRYNSTKEGDVIARVLNKIKALKIDTADYFLLIKGEKFEAGNIPDRWIWQDIGNYYGAGSSAFNWRENQYDLILRSGSEIGSRVEIAGIEPDLYNPYEIISHVTAAAKGSGDNAYIYLPSNGGKGIITGTIPVNENAFRISGAMPDPASEFEGKFSDMNKILVSIASTRMADNGPQDFSGVTDKTATIFHTEISPSLDSIIYWFLKKSVNLYGEALIKTFAYEKQGFGSTDSGTAIVKKFWKDKGIDEDELNIYDGSGLSPMNRVTTHAQVEILKYAKTRDWFKYFYDGLPEYNGIKMKSGTIGDVKGFCGYHRSKDGKEYIFSFLVNNYSGSGISNKMYKVLDELK
jgi:serine-type D-Ala-D-Ala carboxypeptidase/endopeptidase (penicillin-binding protein 4)